MRISDLLFFAPDVPFERVDFSPATIAPLFAHRVSGFYLEPSRRAAHAGDAFASGLLLVSCIDALAMYRYERLHESNPRNGKYFKHFLKDQLSSFGSEPDRVAMWRDFRCGLVHEARIKNGGQFSLELPSPLLCERGILVANPERLLPEVQRALEAFVQHLEAHPRALNGFTSTLRKQFSKEITAARPYNVRCLTSGCS